MHEATPTPSCGCVGLNLEGEALTCGVLSVPVESATDVRFAQKILPQQRCRDEFPIRFRLVQIRLTSKGSPGCLPLCVPPVDGWFAHRGRHPFPRFNVRRERY